jgi:Alanine-zipper, major outer membrane lipoprotein
MGTRQPPLAGGATAHWAGGQGAKAGDRFAVPAGGDVTGRLILSWRGSIALCIGGSENPEGTDRGMDEGTDTGIDRGTDNGEGTWLTYSELAESRRIDRHSAVKLVTRHRWRRQKDNRGMLRILVPPEWLTSRGADTGTDKGTDIGTDKVTDMGTDMSRVIITLQAAVTSLTERADAAEKRADRAETRSEQAESRADRAERTISEERNRADRAEQGRDEDRARADALADQVDTMRAELAAAEHAAEQARADARAAQEGAVAQRQADVAARKARGMLARLRAAVRGE